MYPSNGIQDTSSFLFSDNMCTNPSSTIEDLSSSSLLNVFPSSHLVDFNDNTVFFQDFHDILHQKVNGQEMDQEIVTYEGASNISMSKIDVKKKKLSCGGSSKLCEQIRVKRKCHKDRHSKITTANGSSRGRRMRLSLNVAKEFFALQDMLEFDKASKTVEWLLKNSENSIKEETMKRAKMSHIPCPSTSAIDPEPPTSKEKTRGTQKVSATHPVTRGSRGKARARARERTQKKKQLQLVGGVTDINDRSRLYNCSQGMNIGSDHPSLNCEKSSAAGNKFLDMGARARERTQKQKQLQLVGGVTDNDRSRLHNCSQGMNIGSDHYSLNCEKSAAAGNKFLDMRNGSPAPVLEFEDILNYSKQQPHSFEGIEN